MGIAHITAEIRCHPKTKDCISNLIVSCVQSIEPLLYLLLIAENAKSTRFIPPKSLSLQERQTRRNLHWSRRAAAFAKAACSKTKKPSAIYMQRHIMVIIVAIPDYISGPVKFPVPIKDQQSSLIWSRHRLSLWEHTYLVTQYISWISY